MRVWKIIYYEKAYCFTGVTLEKKFGDVLSVSVPSQGSVHAHSLMFPVSGAMLSTPSTYLKGKHSLQMLLNTSTDTRAHAHTHAHTLTHTLVPPETEQPLLLYLFGPSELQP